MNTITIIGNLTRDPELRTTPQGNTVCELNVAVNSKHFTSANGERETDFFRVSVWGKTGENCAKYLAKGRKVAVSGEMHARSYETKDGKQGFSLEVRADAVDFLSPRNEGEGGSYSQERYAPSDSAATSGAPAAKANFVNVDDDDLPF